jgi:ATP-dependent DNA ligase
LRGSFILDGEVCLLDERGVPNFEGMRRRRGEGFRYCVFDLLYYNGRDLRSLPLLKRKERLRKLIPANSPTEEEIKDAVRVVGNSATKVREHLGTR